ncbi:HipA domain-containing protein [Anaerovorax odorimutans]|uniref:HipA domain-containing protein n=1 Tax=Anaerovorax odorimutans TaxID=109327 RepID=UPI0003FCC47D|nr:HipA domain-containing protein [Anaerovorax odorimutans]
MKYQYFNFIDNDRPNEMIKGKLTKWFVNGEYIKAARLKVRGMDALGIEPIIEVIAYKLGVLLGLNIAEQRLGVAKFKKTDKEYVSLVSISPDFVKDSELLELKDFAEVYDINENVSIEDLIKNKKIPTENEKLWSLMIFDYIIMNEDRHNQNIAWIYSEADEGSLSPIYDNGYSMLYDAVPKMCEDFKREAKNCVCNASFYNDRFSYIETYIQKIKERNNLEDFINLGISEEQLVYIVEEVKMEYNNIKEEHKLMNKEVPKEWWTSVVQFLKWRIEYVRKI